MMGKFYSPMDIYYIGKRDETTKVTIQLTGTGANKSI
jgi:hypothetical protein